MNWSKLAEKFPNSEKEIREFNNKEKIKDGRNLIQSFLISKDYKIKLGFINELKNYEQRFNN
tara:strand:+ start:474 stop:659 length:186 start_codon:yes stop_codon:yes gene_type:complete